jgi:predicted nucleic acid-binding protein
VTARLLPDTCAWIDFFRGRATPLAVAVEKALLDGTAVTCGVVLFELTQGIKTPAEEAAVITAFAAVPSIELTDALWVEAGRLSAQLRSQGHTLPLSDLLIAVLAKAYNVTVLTIDQHFARVPGVRVVEG